MLTGVLITQYIKAGHTLLHDADRGTVGTALIHMLGDIGVYVGDSVARLSVGIHLTPVKLVLRKTQP